MAVKGCVFFCVMAGTLALYLLVLDIASESARQEQICRDRKLTEVWNMQWSLEPCRCSNPNCAFVPCLNMRMEEIKRASCVT